MTPSISIPWAGALSLAVLLGGALTACDSKGGPAKTVTPVQVAPSGSRYEPPVSVAEIPQGAWMCDMGTVHYASPHPGKCPICEMDLTQKR